MEQSAAMGIWPGAGGRRTTRRTGLGVWGAAMLRPYNKRIAWPKGHSPFGNTGYGLNWLQGFLC